ncbi:MAG: serine/threonine-protein kinase, partial [Rubripirellula sp.]|nr:serine/threonine-protein kinase [Rubripirellula sp.]
MSDQRCPSDEELQAFGNMQLGDSDFARVSSHLALCGTCRSSIRRHREGIDLGETIDTRDTGFQEGQPDSRDQAGDDPRPVSTSQPTQQSVLTALAESLERPPSISLSPDESRQGSDAAGQGSKNESSRGFWGPPESNPRYELQDEIARGGMGAILRAKDKDLGRNIAVKVLLDQHKVKPKVIQRFIEEAQIGGQLQHPGIAPVYELGQFADQRPFFSMKLVKGETLSSLLKMRKDLGEERAKFIGVFEQICQTVAYAHSRGVIHRDLKPGNIMVGAFGEVQVMDWGLAKVLQQDASGSENDYSEDVAEQSIIHTPRRAGETTAGDAGDAGGSDALQTVMGTVMGTPSFMPPEQALGRIDIMDERADVFGLGAILCQILTGEPPYLGKNTNTILESARIGALDQCFKRLDTSQADNDL